MIRHTLVRVVFGLLMLDWVGCQSGDDDGDATGGAGVGGGSGASGGASGVSGAGGAAGSSSGGSGAGTGGTSGSGASPASGGSAATSTGGGSSGNGGSAGSTTDIQIHERQIRVGGAPFHIQGVCWNPVPKGGVHPADLDFSAAASVDIPLMVAAGINAVRTYEPLTDTSVLDALYAAGIYVLNTVYPYGGSPPSSAADAVALVKDHPAVLMWVIGNEWNYNGLYVGLSHDASIERLNEVAAAIRAVDASHPISTVYGELPSAETLAAMPQIDVWGLNVYRGLTFGSLFADWAARSGKPFYLAEYGADAYNALIPAYDAQSQAEAVASLTELIWANGSAHEADGTCAGGTLFEWADEWWKDGDGAPGVHDVGGSAPGGGPHPDQTFNEEWWGVVDIDRNPRPAYEELARIFGG